MSNTNDGGPAFPGTVPMDTEKLIERLDRVLRRPKSEGVPVSIEMREETARAILTALRRLAAAEKVVDIARMAAPQMYHCGLMVTSEDLASALSAYDAAKEPPCPSN